MPLVSRCYKNRCYTLEMDEGGNDESRERMHAYQSDSRGAAAHARLRGMPEDGRQLGAPAPMPHLRPRGLLRFIEKQARHQAFSLVQAPDYQIVRAGRRLGLVLYRRGRT